MIKISKKIQSKYTDGGKEKVFGIPSSPPPPPEHENCQFTIIFEYM